MPLQFLALRGLDLYNFLVNAHDKGSHYIEEQALNAKGCGSCNLVRHPAAYRLVRAWRVFSAAGCAAGLMAVVRLQSLRDNALDISFILPGVGQLFGLLILICENVRAKLWLVLRNKWRVTLSRYMCVW